MQHIARAQFAADLLRIGRLALVAEGAVAGDHHRAGDARQIGRQIVGDAVGEIVLLGIVTQIREGQDDNRQARRRKSVRHARFARRDRGRGRGALRLDRQRDRRHPQPSADQGDHHGRGRDAESDTALTCFRPAPRAGRADGFGAAPIDFEGLHRLRDVLQALAAEPDKRRRQLCADLVAHRGGDADAAWFGQGLQPRRDVDAVAEQVLPIDYHVAEMHADTELHAFARGALRIFRGDRLLHRQRAFDGIDRAGEIGEHAVAGRGEDPAAIIGDQPVEDRARGAQRPQRADLVLLHQLAVADDIGREDRGELAFDYLAVCHPGLLAGTDAGLRQLL